MVILIIIGDDSCFVCKTLTVTIYDIIERLSYKNFEIKFVNSKHNIKLFGAKINIRRIPLLLAYKNGKLRLGWEGFAALAPDEIKREMVEDVLRQVAALSDEDDENLSTSEMPQQVRHDNSGEIR